jgi:hypothetical protein
VLSGLRAKGGVKPGDDSGESRESRSADDADGLPDRSVAGGMLLEGGGKMEHQVADRRYNPCKSGMRAQRSARSSEAAGGHRTRWTRAHLGLIRQSPPANRPFSRQSSSSPNRCNGAG